MTRRLFFALAPLLVPALAVCEPVYDSSGRVIRSSEWLQTGGKPRDKSGDAPEKSISDVVEAQKDGDEAALPEQLSMSEKRFSADLVFSGDEIENSHAPGLCEFFQEKGLLAMQSGGAGSKAELSFKGFTAFCIKVYIDGIPANNPATGEFDWNSIDVNSIESIRISEIPEFGASEFAGCSVFIATKSGKKSSLRSEAAVSSYERNGADGIFQSLSYASNEGKFFYRIGASSLFCDNEFSVPEASRNMFNFSKQGGVNFSWSARISGGAPGPGARESESGGDSGGDGSPGPSERTAGIFLSGSNIFAYNSLKVFGTGGSLSTGIEEDFTCQNSVALDAELDDAVLRTSLSYFYGQTDYFEGRTLARDEKATTNSQSLEFRETLSWIFDATAAYKQEHLFSGSGDRHKFELGASKTFARKFDGGGEMSATPCVQLIAWGGAPDGEEWRFEALPRLTLGLMGFYVAGYRIFTLPTFNQLYWKDSALSCGNPRLKPESGWAAAAGFRREGFPLYARFTYSYYENKIRWGYSGTKLMALNTASADYYVGAAGFERKLLGGRLLLRGGCSVTEARLRETKKQIMWVPEFQASASAALRISPLQISADYSYTGRRFVSNENISEYPEFHLLNMGVDLSVNSEFTLYAKASNILDERVVYHDNYYIPSRKFTVGMKFIR